MPELRQSLVTKTWVIIATERAKRPGEFITEPHQSVEEQPAWEPNCPFCRGNEEQELEVMRVPEKGPWRLRVVRNKYPALEHEGEWFSTYNGVQRLTSGVGYHEILVETPRHNLSPAMQHPEDLTLMMQTFQSRGREIRKDQRMQYLICFKNHGERAGASLIHPHTQLMAVPIVPSNILHRLEEAKRHIDETGYCIYCQALTDELEDGQRIVLESEHFVALVPYAAFSPFHLWIMPRYHRSSFLEATPEEMEDLGKILNTVLRKLYVGLNDPAYNYVIRSQPLQVPALAYAHWYLSLVPRVTRAAGFEMGSGMFINSALPEESAAYLRGVSIDKPEITEQI